MKTNIASTICFLGFVAFGLLLTGTNRFLAEPTKRRRTNVFLIFVLIVSFAAGLTQHNLWPFASWPVMAIPMPAAARDLPTPRIMGVDDSGKEYNIDYRAWQPLVWDELISWLNLDFLQLDPQAQDRVGKYLLDRSERAREEALSPSGLAYPNRWLGPLTAPTHILHPAIWSQAGRVPRNSFVGLRIYEESWDLGALRRDPAQVKRVLVYEYPHR